MHVLHVFDHSIPLHSGYTFRSRAILREQHRLGWTTDHLTGPKHNLACALSGDVPLLEHIDGLTFHRCGDRGGWSWRMPLISQYAVIRALQARLFELISQQRPDIIQVHSPALNALAAISVGRRLGVPVVYEIRAFWEDAAVSHGTSKQGGMRYRLTRAMETWAVKQASAVTCICDGIRQDLVARGVPAAKITIVPNAVDSQSFEPVIERDASLAEQLGLIHKPVIGFIGSFYDYEGIDQLIAAVPLLQRQMPELQVLLVGGGPMDEALRQQARQRGVQQSVHFIGRVPHDQVSRYYSLIDILVYPRKSMRITDLVTPLKPLEAMAQKCLFIASDVGGHRELIQDGQTGILFRADDVQDLVAKIITLFDQPKRWSALRDNGRYFVESQRTWQNSVAQYRPLYERLLR